MSLRATQVEGQGVGAMGPADSRVKGPGEDGSDVVAVVGLASGLCTCVKGALVDADVAVVAQMGLDDVVEVDAGGGPLGEGRRGEGEGEGGGQGYDQDTDVAHGATDSETGRGASEASRVGPARVPNTNPPAVHRTP